jgi:hypothetical protein
MFNEAKEPPLANGLIKTTSIDCEFQAEPGDTLKHKWHQSGVGGPEVGFEQPWRTGSSNTDPIGNSNYMIVILRHSHLGLYYAGRKHWVSNPEQALDLETIERAAELGRQEDFPQMEIVVSYGEPDCDLVLPVSGKPPASLDRAA